MHFFRKISTEMAFIKPIKLKNCTLANNIVQGPLAGYSCAPFRVLATQWGQPGFTCTEMISAKDLIHRPVKPKRYLWRDPREGTLCYQLSGNEPDELARAAEMVSAAGADIIDLNCGCPVNKIRRKGCGSRLLAYPELLEQCLRALRQNTDAAVTVKVRISAGDHDDLAVVQAAEAAGVDAIIVHGRDWTQRYDVDCNLTRIRDIKLATQLPVFANGDVEDIASLERTFAATQCDGFMIARASVGRPWLFAQLRAQAAGESFTIPDTATIGQLFLQHIDDLAALENEKLAVLQSRKFAKYYARTMPRAAEFVLTVQQLITRDDVARCIDQFFN